MTKKNRKSVISPILQEILLIIFLQNRFYPDVEFYGLKDSAKNMFLTDKIARKLLCVGGLFYSIIKIEKIRKNADIFESRVQISNYFLTIFL